MIFFSIVILVFLLLLTVFSLANWSVLNAPVTLSLIVYDIEGPLGVILLGAMLGLVVLFVLYALMLRTSMLMESRRCNQELDALRKLAETAEASRLVELRAQIEREFADVRVMSAEISGQMERNVQTMRQSLDETANGLAALVAEMDDKIDRVLARNVDPSLRDPH